MKLSKFTRFIILFMMFISLSTALGVNTALGSDVFNDDVTGTYQHYDGENILTIQMYGTFTVYNKTTGASTAGVWKINTTSEIILSSPNSSKLSSYQIYSTHLFQNGYLVWRKNK